MLHDPSPHQTSSCPVHFLWDGRGTGRVLVRAGFLGFLLAAMCFTLATMGRIPLLETAGAVVLAAAALLWTAGQGFTFVIARQLRREVSARKSERLAERAIERTAAL